MDRKITKVHYCHKLFSDSVVAMVVGGLDFRRIPALLSKVCRCPAMRRGIDAAD